MEDQIIREIPVIQRAAQENEDDDFRFRAFLERGGGGLTSEQLDAVVQKTTDEVWARIDCTTCANCCRALETEVNAGDIERSAARLKVTVEEFRERHVTESDGIDGPYMRLASKPCVFLGEDNLCTVTEDRPDVCRGYPYLYADDFLRRTIGTIGRTAECPIVFNVRQSLKQQIRRPWRPQRHRRR